jgi:hypothetical protein
MQRWDFYEVRKNGRASLMYDKPQNFHEPFIFLILANATEQT